MKKINTAVIGYGNIGKYAVEAIKTAPDIDLTGVVRRNADGDQLPELLNVPVVRDINELGKVDAAILSVPTMNVRENAVFYLKKGVHTVDSFDIHNEIIGLKNELDALAKKYNAVSVISAGWDPGSDSVIRALLEAAAPRGITHTNFGPGMSMGHSVAARNVKGVADALSMTYPMGSGVHRRVVYIQLKKGASFDEAADGIKKDPYFIRDETVVIPVDEIDSIKDMGHSAHLTRKGVSGQTHNQLFDFNMKIHNPALTAQIMVSCVRACTRQKPGAYTMIELPLVDLLPGDRDHWINKLV